MRILIAVLAVLAVAGCGHTFTVQTKGWTEVHPLPPASVKMVADGTEVCKMQRAPSDPAGLPFQVGCDAGQIPWYAADGVTATCIPTPCPAGKAARFLSVGRVECAP